MDKKDFLVVGIGASAGGLEPLERFFAALPPESGMAFVVLQHLSPDFESKMDELLGRQTPLPIHRVTDGLEVRPDAIYLIPPRKEMIVSGGRLLLTDKDDAHGFSLPIDHFFRALAHDMGRRAVGIVLSGAGSDGSRGIRDIHEAGGLVLCQTPEAARFQGMPLSAKQTGLVDAFLEAAEMPAKLLKWARDPTRLADDGHELDERRHDSGMDEILALLRTEHGIDFAHYKPSTVTRRIERRLALTGETALAGYARLLAASPDELNALYRDLLIGVTRFFRDPEAFDRLQTEIIPGILGRVPPQDEIRVWVPACATGEEAYSLAILLHEQLEAAHRPLHLRIFATDVHRASLDVASAGLYPKEAIAEMAPSRRDRYLTEDGSRYRVAKELRQLVVFAQHNVISDAPFTRLDLIACRNLLIYFQPLVQKKVLSLLHFGLKTGGTILLGPSETPGELSDEFDTLDGHWRIYRKRRDARLPDLRLPLAVTRAAPPRGLLGGGRSWPGPHLLSLYDQLLSKAMPPSLLVDEHYQLLHTFGGAEQMLRIKGGRATTNVLDLVDDAIKTALLGAMQHAHKERTVVSLSSIPFEGRDGQRRELRLTVDPLEPVGGTTHFLIQMASGEPTRLALDSAKAVDVPEVSRDYVTALEGELRFTKESLQATIEELETANEELQATNEELVASNEELQSTNEELHSVNEELYTVNVEHQRKITQLAEMTDDLDNLLHSIDVGVLFLDENLCIRKYTSQIAQVFRLLPQDVGRRFDSFAPTIQHDGLEADVLRVRDHGHPVERQVTSREGTIYLMRVLPYRSASTKRGVVVTLIDISTLKQAEAHVRQLSSIVEGASDAVISQDLDDKIVSWNSGAEHLLGYSAEEMVGRDVKQLVPADKLDETVTITARAAAGEIVPPYETVRLRRDGSALDVQLSLSPLFDEHNSVVGVGTIARDITQRKQDELAVRRAVKMRDQFMAMLSHELRNPLSALLHASSLLKNPREGEGLLNRRALAVVERQVKHMARLLDDLLDVSRMRQEGIELRKQAIDLRQTIDIAVERVRPLADSGGVELEVTLPGDSVPVFGDPDRLQQVVVNLLTNAVKYSPDGGQAALSLAIRDGKVRLAVRDQGIGVPPEMLERIFEPFVRAVDDDGHHGPHAGGMGLGLALVRSFVRAHDGTVHAHSDGPGKGSEFVVTLPLAERASLEAGESAAALGSECIVLVEDQDDIRDLLTVILQDAGYTVLSAGDGASALSLIERHRPGIALVDIGLPVASGYEVAERVRKSFGPSDIFLVALTGYGQQQDREEVLRAGFDQHIVKPVDGSTLLEVLRARRRIRSDLRV